MAGAIIIGSHVKKTTEQLEQLLQQDGVQGIEIDVSRISNQRAQLLSDIVALSKDCHAKRDDQRNTLASGRIRFG